jgi:hypothetical protein
MRRLVTFAVVLGIAAACFGKAYYAGKVEMVRKAECIAVVNITKVEATSRKGQTWTYSQKASGTVEQCQKGNARGRIEIYGMEDFICAQCRYETGRFILFLRRDGGLWVGSNWHLGIRPVRDGRVEWFKDDASRFEMKDVPLDAVLAEIKAILDGQVVGLRSVKHG